MLGVYKKTWLYLIICRCRLSAFPEIGGTENGLEKIISFFHSSAAFETKEIISICRCTMFNEVVAKSRKSGKIKMLGNLLEAGPFNEFSL